MPSSSRKSNHARRKEVKPMTNIILSGCNGKMGQVITRLCEADEAVKIVCGVDINTEKKSDYPVYSSYNNIKKKTM